MKSLVLKICWHVFVRPRQLLRWNVLFLPKYVKTASTFSTCCKYIVYDHEVPKLDFLMTGSDWFVYIYTHALATQWTKNLNNERGKSRVHCEKFRVYCVPSALVYMSFMWRPRHFTFCHITQKLWTVAPRRVLTKPVCFTWFTRDQKKCFFY